MISYTLKKQLKESKCGINNSIGDREEISISKTSYNNKQIAVRNLSSKRLLNLEDMRRKIGEYIREDSEVKLQSEIGYVTPLTKNLEKKKRFGKNKN